MRDQGWIETVRDGRKMRIYLGPAAQQYLKNEESTETVGIPNNSAPRSPPDLRLVRPSAVQQVTESKPQRDYQVPNSRKAG